MSPDVLLAFAMTSALIELTPGPNMAYLALLAATEGRKAGVAAVAGVALGLAIVGALAAFGVAALISSSEWVYQSLRWGGVAYLLWLAWDGWRGAAEQVEHAPLGSTLWRYFQRGLITNLLNPKAAVFYVAVLPSFLADTAALPQTMTLCAIYVAVATAIHLAIVLLASTAQRFFDNPVRERILRRVLSIGLGVVAIWFAFKTAR
ncbi:LysE family translocator [Albirhodobacter sp. R86504]|uniref:LysE family translocator n=1 Tax=Albirhodobacter sp. R86504 TaxID=3093848 RepID=UPI003671C4CC